MSWLFSKALINSVNLPSSQVQEAESSADTFSDGEPSAQWNVMPTPQGFWRNDKMMDASRLSRFGPTLRLLTGQHGEAVLTSFLEAFPARTYPQPDEEKESAEPDQDSGLSSLESLAKFDPDSSSWKTPQYSLLGGLESFSETWPRWGTMRNGECWVRQTWEPRTKEIGSGLWPTPTARDYRGSFSPDSQAFKDRLNHPRGVNLVEEMQRRTGEPGLLNPPFLEWLMGWPIGWTELKPLETGKFREWQQQHS